MKNIDLLKKLKPHKGPIYVAMLVQDDVVSVRAYKNDLIDILERASPNGGMMQIIRQDETGMYLDAAS